MTSKSAHILLIEDNQVDVVLTKRAFKKKGALEYQFTVAENGYRAMQFFNTLKDNPNAKEPDLILLDINMPRANGFDVLHFMKSAPSLRHIPVIILSGSRGVEDVRKCYQSYCNCYIVKPRSPEEYERMVVAIENFWFGVVLLPTYEEAPSPAV